MPEPPLVTVLMSVYNDAAYLSPAVNSVLRQTFTDLELLVIDDGSTDESPRILSAVRDPRLRIVRHETNHGLTRSLKRGVELAEGRYIARLDADDVAFPDRLEWQVAFLEQHPEFVLLGGGCVQVDEAGSFVRVWRPPVSDLEVRWLSLLTNPFVHSTVMLRRQVLRDHGLNYDEAFATAQDYDLWDRLLRVGQGGNLREPLIYYRVRPGITGRRRELQLAGAASVALRRLQEELPDFVVDRGELEALFAAIVQCRPADPHEPERGVDLPALYDRLLSQFGAKRREHPDWHGVRRNFADALARSAWCRCFPRGSLRALVRAVATDPLVVVRLMRDRRHARAERRRFSTGLNWAGGA